MTAALLTAAWPAPDVISQAWSETTGEQLSERHAQRVEEMSERLRWLTRLELESPHHPNLYSEVIKLGEQMRALGKEHRSKEPQAGRVDETARFRQIMEEQFKPLSRRLARPMSEAQLSNVVAHLTKRIHQVVSEGERAATLLARTILIASHMEVKVVAISPPQASRDIAVPLFVVPEIQKVLNDFKSMAATNRFRIELEN